MCVCVYTCVPVCEIYPCVRVCAWVCMCVHLCVYVCLGVLVANKRALCYRGIPQSDVKTDWIDEFYGVLVSGGNL